MNKDLQIDVNDEIKVYEMVMKNAKDPGDKKPAHEIRVGDDLYKKTGEWDKLERIIDRKNDWYFKEVRDRVTNKVLYRCSEPLSKHTGHGSAKKGVK